MLRWGSGRIYGCLQWGSGGSPEPRGPPRSFSLAKKDFPCSASQIAGSSREWGHFGAAEPREEPMGRAPTSLGAASCCWDEEMGLEGWRELREMKRAADIVLY